jgi:hypothetical protein
MNGADATGDTGSIDATTTNVMVLDRATGELVPVAFPAGTAALVQAGLRELATNDRTNATEAGEQLRSTDLTVTVTADNGASVTITGNTVVGNDIEAPSWSRVSATAALQTALAISGAMAPHIEARLVEMLNAVQDGMEWDDAFEQVVGERQSDENAARVAEIIDSLRREVVGPRRGRQQASRVVVQTN